MRYWHPGSPLRLDLPPRPPAKDRLVVAWVDRDFCPLLWWRNLERLDSGWANTGGSLNRSALVIAGAFFLVSVCQHKAATWKNYIGTLLITVLAVGYVEISLCNVRKPTPYLAILAAIAVLAVWNSLRFNPWRNRAWAWTWLALAPYLVFAMSRAAQGEFREGFDFYLFSLFSVIGVLYVLHFRRLDSRRHLYLHCVCGLGRDLPAWGVFLLPRRSCLRCPLGPAKVLRCLRNADDSF